MFLKNMNIIYILIGIGIAFSIMIAVLYLWAIHIASKSIFPGSGAPISMSQVLLSSIHVTSQILFGLLAIIIISILLFEKIISSDAGLPIMSAIVAYLLGKGAKDIGPLTKNS